MNNKKHTIWFYLAAAIGLLVASSAFAQAVNPNDMLAPYRDYKPPEDLATRVMEGLLGEMYTSPLTSGLGASTLFGSIFLVFNVVVFAVGTVWASYGVISGVVQTAHEGVVLGKRLSSVWMPVRMVTGIGGLVPAFGGFSLAQVAMILATSWGIAFANFAYKEAITAGASSATLLNVSTTKTAPNKDTYALAMTLFKQRLCERGYNHKKNDLEAAGNTVATADRLKQFTLESVAPGQIPGHVVGYAIGTDGDKTHCFGAGLSHKKGDTGRESSSLGFRSGAVDYDAINNQVWNAYQSNFSTFTGRVHQIADTYYAARANPNGQEVRVPVDEIKAAGVWYLGAVEAGGNASVNHKLIKEEALTNMQKHGFFSAGSFYSTWAEATAAVAQATDAVDVVIVYPSARDKFSSGDYDSITYPEERDSERSAGNKWCMGTENATGNCSLGQVFVKKLLEAGTAGSGGSTTLIDPIIALKNIGDYMMTTGEGIMMATVVTGSSDGVVSKTVSTIGSVLNKIPGPIGFAADLVKALGAMAPYIGGLLFAVGAMCAIYIPMVPFINWVSALVQYCCIVVEGLAAAPLWALAHLQAEGEGMGQRTERGYLYLLNLLFRPILMVAAFFAASALVILLGSVVYQMYLPAIASAQGNSVTGIFSVIGYVFLFFVIMNIIITGLFHLVMELSDDAIGWVGGIGRNNIGRDAEGKINQMFVMGGRFGAGLTERAGAASGGGVVRGTLPDSLDPSRSQTGMPRR